MAGTLTTTTVIESLAAQGLPSIQSGPENQSIKASISEERRQRSLTEVPVDVNAVLGGTALQGDSTNTFLYLGYGSNLSTQAFRKSRGIKPLAQVNVVVPELTLTFDLAALPYMEPCFANVRYRQQRPAATANTPLIQTNHKYNKDSWKKGLVGVVYEVTQKDYATIVRTEGGGASYSDIVVECFPLLQDDIVPETPTSKPFKAHTLYAPAFQSDQPGAQRGGRIVRPDPSYAQPSIRYMKLLTNGSEELSLPQEYRDFLYSIGTYRVTQIRQRLGIFVMYSVWGPVLVGIYALKHLFSNKKGKSPDWLNSLAALTFQTLWKGYDLFYKPLFGDGERIMKADDDARGNRAEKVV
ncbi:MAG: hypothetical protein M1814_003955 [Vezdaea aestivalis]|nr:MAG: hypothetical protein M1814_003955 [Vezdaea aestivalis]